MFKRIVVGCDGTAEGRDAVALGASIARATGAGLSLVGVYPTSLFPVAGITDRETVRTQAEQALRRERDLLAPDALIDARGDASVARALRHYAERWHADLVVVGSSARAAQGHAAISRRSRQLLGDAPFALAIAARGGHARAGRLRAVGVGYDGGPEAEAALELAAEVVRGGRARLLVREVVEDRVPRLSGDDWLATEDWSRLWEGARKAAFDEARSAVTALEQPADVTATVGDPGYELRELSEQVDLLVVGSRRWGPMARLVSGGVGETLVADSCCSVLIVPRGRGVWRESAAGRPLAAATVR